MHNSSCSLNHTPKMILKYAVVTSGGAERLVEARRLGFRVLLLYEE